MVKTSAVPSVLVKIDERPATKFKNQYMRMIANAVREACKEAEMEFGGNAAVRVNITYRLPSKIAESTPISGKVDHDNLDAVVHSALKEKNGGPLPNNSIIAISDSLKVSGGKTGSMIIELQLLDRTKPEIGSANHSTNLERFGYKPVQPMPPRSSSPKATTFDFLVRGPIASSSTEQSVKAAFQDHVLDSWKVAAREAGFPARLEGNQLVHLTTILRYPERRRDDGHETAGLRISKPDITQVLKSFYDAIRGHDPEMPMIDDDQIAGGVTFKIDAVPTAFASEGIFTRVHLIKSAKDLCTPQSLSEAISMYDSLARREAAKALSVYSNAAEAATTRQPTKPLQPPAPSFNFFSFLRRLAA